MKTEIVLKLERKLYKIERKIEKLDNEFNKKVETSQIEIHLF